MNLKSVLDSNDAILQVVSKFKYQDSLCSLMKSLKGQKICYVSLNKPAENVCEGLDKKKISTSNTFFIDAVSKSLGHNVEKDNVLYVSSPSALTELSIAIISALKGNSFDAFVFDSLSTLDIYNMGNESERFLRAFSRIVYIVLFFPLGTIQHFALSCTKQVPKRHNNNNSDNTTTTTNNNNNNNNTTDNNNFYHVTLS